MQSNLLISGLLDWYHWKVGIDKVTKEYHDNFEYYMDYMDGMVLVYNQRWLINYRKLTDPIFLVKIRNFYKNQCSAVYDY